MILNIRGTHGVGKSFLVNRIKRLYSCALPWHVERRKQPMGYRCSGLGMRPLHILGHYETPAGGCDSIKTVDQIFDPIKASIAAGENLLFEGIIAQNTIHRFLEVHELAGGDVDVVVLTTPLEEAIDSVENRRIAAGRYDPLDPDNTIREYKAVLSSTRRLKEYGVRVLELDREAAFQFVEGKLRVGVAPCAE